MSSNRVLQFLTEQSHFLRTNDMSPGAWLPFEFVIRNGIDTPTVAKHRHKNGLPKRCFNNSFKLVQKFRNLTYMEGYIIFKGKPPFLPIHHAWAVNTKNEIVDITLDGNEFEYYGVMLDLETVMQNFHPEGYGVFDTGRGINLRFFFRVDPTIYDLVPDKIRDIYSRHLTA